MPPRRSQRRPAEDEDEDDDDRSMDVDGDEENAAGPAGGGAADVTRRANLLVRLALFHEQKGSILRRDEISKKVLTGSKSFAPVLTAAQNILSNTFGMELVELKNRSADDEPAEELDEARKATGQKKKATSGTKSFILRSKLPPNLIEAALETDDDILAAETADPDNELPDEDTVHPSGALIAYKEPGSAGVLYVILALVLVSGRCIGDAELRSYLKKLRLSTVAFSPLSTSRTVALDTYLQTLIKQGYLDRLSLADVGKKTGKGAKAKRVRADDGEGNGPKYEWRWGPRAYSEVGETPLGQFVAEFMVGPTDEDGGRAKEKEREKKIEKMRAGIGRAAGSKLDDFK